MKLQGEVLKRFSDSQNGGKIYAPKGTVDVEAYTKKETVYPHVFTAEKERYEELERKGYIAKGKLVEDKRESFRVSKEEE